MRIVLYEVNVSIADVISAIAGIAWPVVVLVVFFVLRKHVVLLLSTMTRVELSGFKAEFERALLQAAANGPPETAQSDVAVALSGISAPERPKEPALRVLAAWSSVERALNEAGIRMGVRGSETAFQPQLVDRLIRDKQLQVEIKKAILDLRRLRNMIAHANYDEMKQVTDDDASRYERLCQSVEQEIGKMS